MADVKKVKDWKKKQELVNSEQDSPQFEILFEDSDGIKSIRRIIDQMIFDINVDYPAFRGDYFRFTRFNQNKITVEFKIITDNETFGVGHCQANDIIIHNGFFTDKLLEKSIKELALTGIPKMLETKK